MLDNQTDRLMTSTCSHITHLMTLSANTCMIIGLNIQLINQRARFRSRLSYCQHSQGGFVEVMIKQLILRNWNYHITTFMTMPHWTKWQTSNASSTRENSLLLFTTNKHNISGKKGKSQHEFILIYCKNNGSLRVCWSPVDCNLHLCYVKLKKTREAPGGTHSLCWLKKKKAWSNQMFSYYSRKNIEKKKGRKRRPLFTAY